MKKLRATMPTHNTFELIGNTRLISPLLTEGYASGDTKKWAEVRRRKRSVWKNPSPQSVTKYITL